MTKKKKTTKKKPAKRQQKKNKPLLWRVFRWCFILGLWSVLILGCVIAWFAKDLPNITETAIFERRASIIIQSSDGDVIARYGESKGENINAKDMPEHLIQAILATEDRRFYKHPGVDLWGLARAMTINISKGRFVQGGSTITQQLSKNLFLSHDRKITRKIKEAILAIWLERELSKDDILSAYMNRVYLGSGTYGFNAAALLYFGKPAKDTNLREAAILAGLLKAPSRYSPHNNITLANERAQVVLTAMSHAGYISKARIKEAQKMPLSLPHAKNIKTKNTRYFTDWVIEGLDNLIGQANLDIVVHTTLDRELQTHAHNILNRTINNADEMAFVSQGALLSMRPDGAVIAMVGGVDYSQSQFNRTIQSRRAPGSSFKPFVYLSALEKGWHEDDILLDAPITEGSYRPKNFANVYYDKVTLADALAKSTNTATVRLMQEIGVSSVMDTARRLGILSKLERDLSLALGSSGVSMLEMATAYAVIANGGYTIYPYAITRITDSNGRILFERKKIKNHHSTINSNHARELTFMMQNVINNGTARRAQLPFPAAGKTGTSQESRDAWFVGFTDRIVSVVWLGNDDNSPMRDVTGGGLPADIWKSIMMFGNARHPSVDIQGQTRPQENKHNGGFSNMLSRVLSSGEKAQKNNGRRNDYSNLND